MHGYVVLILFFCAGGGCLESYDGCVGPALALARGMLSSSKPGFVLTGGKVFRVYSWRFQRKCVRAIVRGWGRQTLGG